MKRFLFQMVTVPVMFGILTGLYVQAASAKEVETVCIKVFTQEVQKNGSSVIHISTMCEKGAITPQRASRLTTNGARCFELGGTK